MKSALLLVGGAGYIGSHTAFLAAQHNYEIIIIDSFVHKQVFRPLWARVFRADFTDANLLEYIFSTYHIQTVMHFAAAIDVNQSLNHPAEFYQTNVAKTLTLLDTMLAHGIRKFIFSSSCAVYGNPQWTPITEDHPYNPLSPYGRTKRMIEEILHDYHKAYDFNYVCLRYFNAAGALPEQGLGEHHEPETHIIPLLLDTAKNKKTFYAYGTDYPTKDGSAVRDYLHVLDIAHAHVKAAQHLFQDKPSDTFNLGTGQGISVKEMIQSVEQTCQIKLDVIWEKQREGDPALLIANATKAETILNWSARYSDIKFIIQSALAHHYQTHTKESQPTNKPYTIL